MRQFFSWRFWATLVALVVVTAAIVVFTSDDSASDDRGQRTTENRRVDLASFVYTAEQDRFRMVDGYSRGFLNLVLDGARTVHIQPGTPGEVSCERLDEPGRCGVVADLLGDAVVWFAILPLGPRLTIELPPIVDLEDGYAILTNAWELRYAPVLDRRCDKETESFQQFLRELGPESTTIVDPGENRVTAVAC